MFAGKIKAALNMLSQAQNGGVLHLNDPSDPNSPDSPTVRDMLYSKHPQGQYAHAECIIPSALQDVHPVIFESIDANAIRSAALQTTGSAGPMVLMRTNGDACALPLRVHLLTCATHLPW